MKRPRSSATGFASWRARSVEIDDLIAQPGEWLSGEGPESDIVISTRLRLARNIKGFPFVSRATREHKSKILAHITGRLRKSALGKQLVFFNLHEAEAVDRLFLVERHLISKEHANSEGERSVAFEPAEVRSIMINEEDHLRIQVLKSGFATTEAYEEVSGLDDLIESQLDYAFSPRYGYLTACPTNAGTGMRVSIMFHLPALVMTRQIEKVFQAVSKIHLAVRGLFGEGTQASGDFYQISNQVTLGVSENEILDKVRKVVPKIIEYERNIRETISHESKKTIEDRVWRALGTLQSARSIQSEETLNLLSQVRLGVNMKLISNLPIQTVNELFIQSQPAHIQKLEGKILEEEERDIARAAFLRKRLN
ncbi:MAG: protein arginine kinase [Planctomycetes bacterium]|nr:protein arginine kinase [Planctomycetota bacterium]